MVRSALAHSPVTCDATDADSWTRGFPAWVALARLCNKYSPRGKSYLPRLIGRVLGNNRRACIRTQKGAYLAVEPASLDVYAWILNQGGVWNKHVFDACAALLSPGQVFYDIGANVGFMSIEMAQTFGDEVTVVSFEPQQALSRIISVSAKLNKFNNVLVFDLMLGAEEGESGFFLSSHSIHASSIAREEGAVEITRPMSTIDELVSTAAIPPPHVIKLDIEGGELAALSGAQRTITDHQPAIVFESDENMSRFGYSRQDLLALIGSLGNYDFFFIDSLDHQLIPITDSNLMASYSDILAKPLGSE